MQDFMKLYSGIVERCFLACAQDFTTKALTSNEVSGAVESCRGRSEEAEMESYDSSIVGIS